jgi:hypothetical protein
MVPRATPERPGREFPAAAGQAHSFLTTAVFAELRPDLEVWPAGYVSRIADNLLSGVEARHFVEHFKNGDGREPDLFGFLDVAQLIKHAFGLARCFKARPTTLLYLCWEPLDADRHPMFRQHRREIERFSDLVAGGFPAFCTQSYSELRAVWQEAAQPKWLRDHAAQLIARYAIPLDGG